MCGVIGIVGLGSPVRLGDDDAVRLRDTMLHRGPDSAGRWRCPWALLGHRRLEVIAPGPEGHQPMCTPDGRFALVYNGELYNDAELRRALEAEGVRFQTRCDTETVLWALARWGEQAVSRFRGMFALGFVDTVENRLILSRDPLGIKPLYAARVVTPDGPQVVFASEPTAILGHPSMAIEPDWAVVSAYLTTIRPLLGRRTMFAGLETLLPGETRVYDASTPDAPRVLDAWEAGERSGLSDPAETVEVIAEAVRSHLRTDVPMCALLSGGLDSAAVVSLAHRDLSERLHTYCAGAKMGGFDDDFTHADAMARGLGTTHAEVTIDQALFGSRWAQLIDQTGVPVSTPNEIAIHAVALALRADGHVVTLSGEGADELFGGYAPPMMQAAAHVAALDGRPDADGGLFHLLSNAWVSPQIKGSVLRDGILARADGDAALAEEYQRTFADLAADAPGDSPLQPHLRFHRRMNLPNLLRRLDSTTMLASVEGRTPFADIRVARFAESLAMAEKFVPGEPARTKIALREAFRDVLPGSVVDRPKASFPLPFQSWMGPLAEGLRTSPFASEIFTRESVDAVSGHPEGLWTLAWPMINIAAWGDRWWGPGTLAEQFGAQAAGAVTTR
ncbi:MAG: asparagine synthase (glutamine-hydrolyzing) [Phycisphaerales bacterium]|nr:asparagine synthase (glutamine-hydrolyzing) [Planctomycetota bacterium]MCH8507593.1 asparagine synthase (glutamine-hydrolyzing) [Phycisphaerales bacterium]